MTSNLIKNKVIWIAWEQHRRTLELCGFLGIKPIILTSNWPRIFKYPLLSIKTVSNLFHYKPDTLIVQNPSVVLSLLACWLKYVFGYQLIVDTHNAGIIPENSFLKKLSRIYRYIQASADFTVVTNNHLADKVTGNNGRAFVLPDRIPNGYAESFSTKANNKFEVVYICTFGIDEPYEEVIKAADSLKNRDISFHITGNQKKLGNVSLDCGSIVNFTGYLPEDEYWKLLQSADLIIDLTYREDCMVCGSYEAVAVKVPMILSDSAVQREYFYKGAVFSKNTAEEIVLNILKAKNSIYELKKEVAELKEEICSKWDILGRGFIEIIDMPKGIS